MRTGWLMMPIVSQTPLRVDSLDLVNTQLVTVVGTGQCGLYLRP